MIKRDCKIKDILEFCLNIRKGFASFLKFVKLFTESNFELHILSGFLPRIRELAAFYNLLNCVIVSLSIIKVINHLTKN